MYINSTWFLKTIKHLKRHEFISSYYNIVKIHHKILKPHSRGWVYLSQDWASHPLVHLGSTSLPWDSILSWWPLRSSLLMTVFHLQGDMLSKVSATRNETSLKHLKSGQQANRSWAIPSGWGIRRIITYSWLNTTGVLCLRRGTVYYLGSGVLTVCQFKSAGFGARHF